MKDMYLIEKKENIFESVGLGKYYEMPKNYFYMIYIDEESLIL